MYTFFYHICLNIRKWQLIWAILVFVALSVHGQEGQSPIVLNETGELSYQKSPNGDRVLDFSYAGYQGGDKSIPAAEVEIYVPAKSGDATTRIQRAIDYVSKLPVNKNGLRGAVLLGEGDYGVLGTIRLHTSGVVLRGSGFGDKGTRILGLGTTRETLIQICGINDPIYTDVQNVKSSYVPVGSMSIAVERGAEFKVGDKIRIKRPSTQAWIDSLGASHFGGGITYLGWKPGRRDVYWLREILRIDGNTIWIDAPITTALDPKFGGGTVEKYAWRGRVQEIGIENIKLESAFDSTNRKDEDHRWMAITIENASNVWVRSMTFKHFAGSAVYVLPSASKLTVEDCISIAPISEVGGERRYTFYTKGQQTLFQRLYSEEGYHDFSVGYLASGPNVFLQCQAIGAHSFSGAIDSWASGALFDIVDIDGQALSFKNRGQDGQGAGWSAANSVFWQCSASLIESFRPQTAQNWTFGSWAQFQGDGYWEQSNEHINPRSLYYQQLADRKVEDAEERAILLPVPTEASSSPTVEVAAKLTALAYQPIPTLRKFIEQAETRNSFDTNKKNIRNVETLPVIKEADVAIAPSMRVYSGWLVRGNRVLIGAKSDVQWWNGSARSYALKDMRPHITRFVPGEHGLGLTDDLQETADRMQDENILSIDHNYGLWYDRRRDDHERVRRIDGDVWPPFYELPFARSGTGLAYDGLSKYDLTKYNKFYWGRLKAFADIADQKGLVLIHQNYFQHNILEAGAHYTDFPWRTANNINNVGFPEPVPYAGDKRLFIAEQFYNVDNEVRREIHKGYIRQCLENFKDNTGVIQMIGAEYTGPLHFVQFWLDVIKEWTANSGRHPIIALSTTKDVQDAILQDADRARTIQAIDIRYWHYQSDGSVYAPKGGQNLAPRQHARLMKPKKTSMEQVYRAVREYRDRYPEKAVLYHGDNYPEMAWAVFMASGSMAAIPKIAESGFLNAASRMKADDKNGIWMLHGDQGVIVYNANSSSLDLDLSNYKGSYTIYHIDPATGETTKKGKIQTGERTTIENSMNAPEIIWLTKN